MESNASNTDVRMIVDFTPSTDSQTSQQSFLSSNELQYVTTPNSGPGDRLRFGSTVDFRLPKEYRTMNHHFNIFVNDCSSSMIQVHGRTKVNDEKLRYTQVALNPKIENIVEIGDLKLRLFIVRGPLASEWPQISNSSPSLPEARTETSSSASNLSQESSKGPRHPQQLVHILNNDLGSRSSQSQVRKVIQKDRETCYWKTIQNVSSTKCRWSFRIVFPVMKVSSK